MIDSSTAREAKRRAEPACAAESANPCPMKRDSHAPRLTGEAAEACRQNESSASTSAAERAAGRQQYRRGDETQNERREDHPTGDVLEPLHQTVTLRVAPDAASCPETQGPRGTRQPADWSGRLVRPGHLTPLTASLEHEETPPLRGFCDKRLKGLEPSTFCMASRRSSQLSYSRAEGRIIAPAHPGVFPGNFARSSPIRRSADPPGWLDLLQ